MNPATRRALAGFSVSVKAFGSQVRLTVIVHGSSHQPTTHTYAKSDRIYFIEASMGDDPGMSEYNFGDDGLVVTNAQGLLLE